jgi:hypothetical protein
MHAECLRMQVDADALSFAFLRFACGSTCLAQRHVMPRCDARYGCILHATMDILLNPSPPPLCAACLSACFLLVTCCLQGAIREVVGNLIANRGLSEFFRGGAGNAPGSGGSSSSSSSGSTAHKNNANAKIGKGVRCVGLPANFFGAIEAGCLCVCARAAARRRSAASASQPASQPASGGVS